MPIPVNVQGGNGNNLNIGKEGDVPVTIHNHPYIGETIESFPASFKFQNSGSHDMRVDGSTMPVIFAINSSPDRDIFINSISIIIADNGASLDEFGNLSALANGVEFVYSASSVGEIMIRDQIKTNLDFIRLGTSTGAVGSGTSSWKTDLSGSGADAYMPIIDMSTMFGYFHGVHLRKGKLDSLFFRINDDLSTGINQFDAIAYGKMV